MFEGNAGDRAHVEGIELDEIAGLRGLILTRFADGIGSGPAPLARRPGPAWGLDELALGPQVREDAADG